MFEIFFGDRPEPFRLPSNPIEARQLRREQARTKAAQSQALFAELQKAIDNTPQASRRARPTVANETPERRRLSRQLDESERKLAILKDKVAGAALDRQLENMRSALEALRPARPVYRE